jgi:hypothetical protein
VGSEAVTGAQALVCLDGAFGGGGGEDARYIKSESK